jgi:cytochrome b561
MAVLVIGMFILGNYMVGLDYYDTWYHQAPWWHKSFGLLLFLILCIRIAVKITNIPLTPLASYKKWEIVIAKITHYLFYLLLFVSCMSGYFVSTAKSVGVEVFNWFEFPAMMTLTESQTDIFGPGAGTGSCRAGFSPLK